ncbi:hypothetical protein [Natrinema ejinorense]|uniref:Uncharacterized protein n=1 Tax=Natrinema ejinorense TaxID=373386 RepID=A0A2A5QVD9_9EURY|nr:hypothetical protein [Natrinema ejinorense]PCR90797.1 hypothetical protein CP557_09885 [Natrinema ejinorense]
MSRRSTGVLVCSLLAFVVGYALWPPRHVYWEGVARVIGEPLTLALVGLLAVGVGLVAGGLLEFSIVEFVAGGVIAYAAGMALIEYVLTTDSPVHFLLYGVLLLCFSLGVSIGAFRRRGSGDRASRSERPSTE